jgi:hypothetical protein
VGWVARSNGFGKELSLASIEFKHPALVMLKVIELAFACYAVTDMKRARAFYEDVLGLKPSTVKNSEHGQWTEVAASATTAALQ